MTEQTLPVVELNEQTLLAEARRRAQLDDFGDESFRVALRRLLQSLEEDADLSAMGRVVQFERSDPVETIPSMASLVYACWRIVCDNAYPKEAGRQWHAILARWTRHCLVKRDKMPEDRFIDVWFKDTLIDPIAQVKRIYDFVGMQLTAEASTYMEDWKAENRRDKIAGSDFAQPQAARGVAARDGRYDKRAAHDYTLEQFGLSEAAIKRDFASYRERFIVNS